MTRPTKAFLVLLSITVVGWTLANPSGRFGVSQFGVTTYSRLPLPYFDVQVRADGTRRLVGKSHDPDAKTLSWLMGPSKPAVVVIGLGWQMGVRADHGFPALAGAKVLAVPTDEALSLYNSLKDQGVSVAIHVHSTC